MAKTRSAGLRVLIMALAIAAGAPAASPDARAAELRVFDLTVKERRIEVPGGTIRVTAGDEVEFRIRSDETGELHLHGYNVSIGLQAGRTTVTVVEAAVAGRFPITAHSFANAAEHPHGRKALFYLEVHPR